MSKTMSTNIWVQREMILSAAFKELKGKAMRVIFLFLNRRQWRQQGGSKSKWYTTNTGLIPKEGDA